MTDQRPREFWISPGNNIGNWHVREWAEKPNAKFSGVDNWVHVIEFAAYEKVSMHRSQREVKLEAENQKLLGRVQALREALSYYASKRHYEFNHTTSQNYIWNDQGCKAREALAKDAEEK